MIIVSLQKKAKKAKEDISVLCPQVKQRLIHNYNYLPTYWFHVLRSLKIQKQNQELTTIGL